MAKIPGYKKTCYICGKLGTQEHHVFGSSNKEKSEEYGMMADICHKHHNGSRNGVHQNYMMNLKLKCEFQIIFENRHSKKEFIKIFGKDYTEIAKALGRLSPMLKTFEELEVKRRTKNPWIRE